MMGPSRAMFVVALCLLGSGRSSKWKLIRGDKKLDGYSCDTNDFSFGSFYKTKTGCAARCVSFFSCLSFFYNPSTYRCYGCKSWYNDKETSGTLSGSLYYEIDVCPDGTVFKRKRSCYFLGILDMSFDQALEHCEDNDAHLFQAETPAENEFLKTYHSQLNLRDDIWYGLTDREEEGVWKWNSSGERITYNDWNEHEPNNKNFAEDCVVLSGNSRKWFDVKCSIEFVITICEKEI